MADPRTRVLRTVLLAGATLGFALGTFALLDALNLRGAWRLFAFLLLTVGIVAGMFLYAAAVLLDSQE